MNAPPDTSISEGNQKQEPGEVASVKTNAVAQPLNGVSMIAAYRAARAAQRLELRASQHQSHLARQRAREERLSRENKPAAPRPQAIPAIKPLPEPCQDPATGSVFANLVSLTVAERPSVTVAEPPQLVAKDTVAPEEPAATATPKAEESLAGVPPADEARSAPVYDPPLAEIGLGPGMLIRLSQLGLHTIGDLAQADAGELRAALGDISRLVDVETWISNARHTARAG